MGFYGAAHIMGGDDLQNLHGAETHVHLDLGQMRSEAIDRVGLALTIRIKGRGRGSKLSSAHRT